MLEWWRGLMVWLDTSFVPVWIMVSVFIAYFIVRFWRDMHVLRTPRGVHHVYDRKSGEYLGSYTDREGDR